MAENIAVNHAIGLVNLDGSAKGLKPSEIKISTKAARPHETAIDAVFGVKPETSGRKTDVRAIVGGELRKSRADTAYQDLLKAREALRRNKISRDDIDAVVSLYDFDQTSSTERDSVKTFLTESKQYSDNGIKDDELEKMLYESIKKGINTPEMQLAFDRLDPDEEKGKYVIDTSDSLEFRMVVQKQTAEVLTKHKPRLEQSRDGVIKARERLDGIKDEIDTVTTSIPETTTKKTNFENQLQDKNTQLIDVESAITEDENKRSTSVSEYKYLTERYQILENADLSNLSNQERNNIRQELIAVRTTLRGKYGNYVKRDALNGEISTIKRVIDSSTTTIAASEERLIELRAQEKEAQEAIDKAVQKHKQRQSELTDDLKQLYEQSAEEYFDTEVSKNIGILESKQMVTAQKIDKAVGKTLYDQLHERWFKNKLIGRDRRGFDKKHIRQDLYKLMQDGPEGYLAQLGVTDPEMVQKFGPQVAKDILRLSNDIGAVSPMMLQELQVLPWSREIIEEMKKDKKFAESLNNYNGGKMKDLLWLTMLVGGSLAAAMKENSKHVDDNSEDEQT